MNRRALLKSLAGAVGASVVPAPVLKPRSVGASRMSIGVEMAKDHALDAMRYCILVLDSKTGKAGLYSYHSTPYKR